jgi:hypothetical protein
VPRRLGPLVAAVVTAAVGAGLGGVLAAPASSAPAAAAPCSGATGVTVVVDRGSLGGGIDQVCNGAGGGKTAAKLFTGSGYSLSYVQRQPGFVCRIDGVPASDPCVNTPPADAYWGLWWSTGTSGSWSYSSLGAGSLTVPDGGYVAFAWQSGSKTAPGVPATAHAEAPPTSATASATPTTKPSSKPSSKPSAKPSSTPSTKASSRPASSPSEAPTVAATETATPTAAPDQTGAASAPPPARAADSAATTLSESASPSTEAAPSVDSATSDPSASTGEAVETEDSAALPVWVVPLVLVLLAGGGASAYLVRRRHRPGP